MLDKVTKSAHLKDSYLFAMQPSDEFECESGQGVGTHSKKKLLSIINKQEELMKAQDEKVFSSHWNIGFSSLATFAALVAFSHIKNERCKQSLIGIMTCIQVSNLIDCAKEAAAYFS